MNLSSFRSAMPGNKTGSDLASKGACNFWIEASSYRHLAPTGPTAEERTFAPRTRPHLPIFDLRRVRVKIPIVMKKRYLLAGASGVIAGAVAAKLLTRPTDVSWPDSIDLIYHPEYSW